MVLDIVGYVGQTTIQGSPSRPLLDGASQTRANNFPSFPQDSLLLAMASSAQPSPKALHYTQELYAVLLRGAWGEPNPGRGPNATALSWSELLRKYRKHTSNDGTCALLSITRCRLTSRCCSPSHSCLISTILVPWFYDDSPCFAILH